DLRTYEFSALARELLSAYPHIRTIALARVMPDSARESFERQMRDSGVYNFRVTQQGAEGGLVKAGERAMTMPIRLFEPLEPDVAALVGFDVLSDPVLERAADEAIGSGSVVASDPIDIPFVGRGIVVFKAIYLGHSS